MKLADLTPEQLEKAQSLKTDEELADFVQEVGLELSDEDLEGVAGGMEQERLSALQQKMAGYFKKKK